MKLFAFISIVSLLPSIISTQTTSQEIIKSELSAPVVLKGNQDANYLKISLIGLDHPRQLHSHINLTLVIDRSGSMSGNRIEKAREAGVFAINLLNSDGQANIGSQSTSELGDFWRTASKESIAVTTIGLGDGYNKAL